MFWCYLYTKYIVHVCDIPKTSYNYVFAECHRDKDAILYSRKLSREKTFTDRQEVTISQRKLSWNAKAYHRLVRTHPTFVEKTFTDGSKTAKFMNVFSLENFALYSTSVTLKTQNLMEMGEGGYDTRDLVHEATMPLPPQTEISG